MQSPEMAPHNDHDHVRFIDRVLDLVRRRHLSRPWAHPDRHSRSAELATDVQHHSSCQRQYSTVQNTTGLVLTHIIRGHPHELTCLLESGLVNFCRRRRRLAGLGHVF